MGGVKYGMEFRPYYMAKEWIKLGHNVTFIGASYSHLRYEQPNVQSDFFEEDIEGIRYIWIKTPVYTSAYKRIMNMLIFVYKLFKNAKKIAQRISPDCVIASSTYPFDIYPSKKIAKKSNAKLIFEVHDLWPLSPMEIGGYSKWHPFILLMQKAENDAYRFSDKVVSLLWNAKEHMTKHGLQAEKFVCIPNGYNKSEWFENENIIPREHCELFQKLKSENKIVIGFSGGLAASGSLDTLIHAAALLKKSVNLVFVFVGKGPEKKSLEDIVLSNKLENIYFLPAVNKKQVAAVISNFDIAYIGGVHSILHQYGTSANKLTDYMLSSLPILFSVDEPNALVERINCGIRIPAESPSELCIAIGNLTSLSKEERREIGERGKNYVTEHLEYSVLAKCFIDEIIK